MNNILKKLIVIIESILATIAMCLFCGYSYVNLFPLVLCILIYYFFSHIDHKYNYISILTSILILFLFIIPGKYLNYYYENYSNFSLIIRLVIIFVGGTILFDFLIQYLYSIFKKKLNNNNNKSIKIFFISFFVIFICWFILLLAEYPGIIQTDTFGSFKQIFGEIPYSNEAGNPILHTIYLKLLYDVISFFSNSFSTTVFYMSFVQIFIHSFVHAYFCYFIYGKTGKLSCTMITIIFYAIISYSANYNVMLLKDSSFGLITELLLLLIMLVNERKTKLNTALYIVVGVLFCLSRKNGIYAYLISVFFIFIFVLIKRNHIKKFVFYLIPLLISFILLKTAIPFITSFLNLNFENTTTSVSNQNEYILTNEDIYYLNEKNSEMKYSFISKSIGNVLIHFPIELPVQEIGNVVSKNRVLTDEEKWIIEQRCPIDVLKGVYDINVVDPTIKAMRENTKPTDSNISSYRYVLLWLNLFKKYPKDYLEAFINMTRCYTYPNRYTECLFFGISDNNYQLKKEFLLSSNFVTKLENFMINLHNNYLMGFLFNPGIAMILVFILFSYGIYLKNIDVLFSNGCLIGIWITIMVACPCADCFRYIYPVLESLPLIILSIFCLQHN